MTQQQHKTMHQERRPPARPRRLAALTGAFAVLILTISGANTARAYELLGLDWDYKPNPMGEAWQICTSGMPANAATIIKRAAAVWTFGGFRFTFRANGCSSGGTYPRLNGVNQIDFGQRPSGVLATNVSIGDNGRTQECDMRFSDDAPLYVGTGKIPSGRIDLYSVAVHEFGHCLGLAHSTVAQRPVMYPSFRFGENRRTLRDDDRRGRAAIYGGG